MQEMFGVCISVIAVLLFVLYKRWTKVYHHWTERGLPQRKPYPLFGNLLQHVLKEKTMGEIMMDIANEYKNEPLIGFYNFVKPGIIINDIKYAEIVMIKEFSSFNNRGEILKLEDMRPLDKHLFFIGDTAWKGVRSKMSPVFTTGKLKLMLPQMEKMFEKVSDLIESSSDNTVVAKDMCELYTMCVRASCVFGQDVTHTTLSSEYMKRVQALANFGFFRFLGSTMALWFPKVAVKFNLSFFGAQHEEYFADMIVKAFRDRTENGIVKQDFLQLLLELKNKGSLEVKQWTQEDEFLKMDAQLSTQTLVIDDDIILAQSFIFLLAGLETILSTEMLTLLELAQNREILEKLRNEIDTVIDKHKEFSFEALKEMDYLEMCIKETSRLYPTVEFAPRRCGKRYTFDNGFTIEKGDDVFVPIIKYQLDPTYFPDPYVYKPERFENLDVPPCAYMPFGIGPRICIGMRFSMMEMKMILSKLVYLYDFTLDPRTKLPVTTDKWFFLRRILSPVYIKFTKRTH